MREPGEYQFSPLVSALVPKPDGRYRVICIPTVSDRIVQRAIVDYLADGDKCRLENSVSYGFIRGRSVKQAVRRAKNLRKRHRWAYKADIAQFFDSIDRQDLINAVKQSVSQRSLHPLLWSAANCEIYEPNRSRQAKIKKAGIVAGQGVRQGMPLSPMFANVLLREFDRQVERCSFDMVRYADDLIVLCDSENQCHAIHDFFAVELGKIGLTVPEPCENSKTRIYRPEEPAEFLGVGLIANGKGYSLNVMKSQTDRIRQRIVSLADFDQLCKQGMTLGRFGQRLENVCTGYIAAYDYCDNATQFEQAVDFAKKTALESLYEEGLGLSLSRLSYQQKTFLGLTV